MHLKILTAYGSFTNTIVNLDETIIKILSSVDNLFGANSFTSMGYGLNVILNFSIYMCILNTQKHIYWGCAVNRLVGKLTKQETETIS